jgi:hypothetical protein
MSVYLFIFLIALIYIKNKYKKEILLYLYQYEALRFIKEQYISFVLLVSLILIMFIGVSNPGTAKEKFKDISDAYNEIVNPEETVRPNPMFDVNTYPETKVW